MNIAIIVFWHGRGAGEYEIKQHLIRTVINRSLFYLMLLYLVTSASFLVSGNKYATTDEEEVIRRKEEKQSGLKEKFAFFF